MFLPGFVLQEAAPKYASFEPASTAITSASRSNTRRHLSKIQTQLATPQGDERALLRNQDPDPALNRRHVDAQIWRLYDGTSRGGVIFYQILHCLPKE